MSGSKIETEFVNGRFVRSMKYIIFASAISFIKKGFLIIVHHILFTKLLMLLINNVIDYKFLTYICIYMYIRALYQNSGIGTLKV